MSEKLCIFCIHGGFTESSGGDYPDPSTFDCAKGLLPRDEREAFFGGDATTMDRPSRNVYSIEDWRKVIVAAQTCKSYTQVKT